jgi:hypothetical protein
MLVITNMSYLPKLAGLLVLLPLAAGCAARTAPFDQMDRAQVTVLRLQAPQQAQQPQTQPGMLPGLPGIPPELQQLGNAAIQGVGQLVPGLTNALPGLVPGMGAQPQQQLPQFKGYSIVAQMPLTDERLKDELLDIFGHESSFNNQVQPCFSPGMGVVFSRPNAPEVDLLVSLSCNQAKIDGARWPYPINGFTPETRASLGRIYEKLWGPVPPGA